MTRLGLLHASPVPVATFDELLGRRLPRARTSHVVGEGLLMDAQLRGPQSVATRVRHRLDGLVAAGADIICCTCSTIGDVAENRGAAVPVFRVDRPMARRAVELGPRIGVVVTLGSTLGPTRALLENEAARVGADLVLDLVTATHAWSRFESGDQQGYLAEVADVAGGLVARVDVILLAQASMAGALPRLPCLGCRYRRARAWR